MGFGVGKAITPRTSRELRRISKDKNILDPSILQTIRTQIHRWRSKRTDGGSKKPLSNKDIEEKLAMQTIRNRSSNAGERVQEQYFPYTKPKAGEDTIDELFDQAFRDAAN